MKLGFIGLGRMGKNMVLRLLKKKHKIVAHNRSPEPIKEVAKKGAIPAFTIDELFSKLNEKPRVIWLMLPAGDVTEEHINKIKHYLNKGDIVIDGGNARYLDSVRRYKMLAEKSVKFLDVGVSGGLIGAKIGYCLMIGGDKEAYQKVEHVFKALATDDGYLYCGPSGSGHYVKMVHNAIEYGMMQAMGEGFELLVNSPYAKDIDLQEISHLWNHGSIVRGFLMECTENAFSKDARLDKLSDYVEDTGEGRWSIQEALERGIPFSVITQSLYIRYRSRQKESFNAKLLAALRQEFGGHAVKEKK